VDKSVYLGMKPIKFNFQHIKLFTGGKVENPVPCPNCGGKDIHIGTYDKPIGDFIYDLDHDRIAACNSCNHYLGIDSDEPLSEDAVIEQWNTYASVKIPE